MPNFNTQNNVPNNFVKNNADFLNLFYGTTDVMPLWIADMDFEVAQPIQEAIQKMAARNIYAYEFNTEELFQAIANWNAERHGLQLDTKSFIQVTGVLTGLSVLVRELTAVGERVMIQTPVYHQFAKLIESANRKVVANPMKIEGGRYVMDYDTLEHQFKTGDIKLFFLCNPHNPVGRVWTKEELQQLVALANKYEVTIISDEIHSEIVYAGSTFTSIASLENTAHHVVVLGSPAKTFGMQSIANGYLYIQEKTLFKKIKEVITAMYLDHGNILSAKATVAAYTQGGAWLQELLQYLATTIQWIEEYISKELPQVILFKPEGTYQIWLDFSGLKLSDTELKALIVKQAKLGLAYGEWFCEDHTQFMRMNIASSLAKIQQAFYQLKDAINK